jgi:hypothetical protein
MEAVVTGQVRATCPFCSYFFQVHASHGVTVDCGWCEAHLVVRADVAGYSLHEARSPIVDQSTLDLAMEHLRPENGNT